MVNIMIISALTCQNYIKMEMFLVFKGYLHSEPTRGLQKLPLRFDTFRSYNLNLTRIFEER